MARSAQTCKSISFIWIFGALYMYISAFLLEIHWSEKKIIAVYLFLLPILWLTLIPTYLLNLFSWKCFLIMPENHFNFHIRQLWCPCHLFHPAISNNMGHICNILNKSCQRFATHSLTYSNIYIRWLRIFETSRYQGNCEGYSIWSTWGP